MPPNLAGGGHSLIEAVISPMSYATLDQLTLFIGLTHPGTLTVPPNSTKYAIFLLKTQHNDAMRTYLLYLLVQRALIQIVIDTIESKYLTWLRNRLTGQVLNDIWDLLFQLFQVYGKIIPKNLREHYEKVASMQYNIDEPLDIIYTSVDDLREIVEMSGKSYTLKQLVDLGYMVVASQPVFRSDLYH